MAIARATGQYQNAADYMQNPNMSNGPPTVADPSWGYQQYPAQYDFNFGYQQPYVQPHINPRFASMFGFDLGFQQQQPGPYGQHAAHGNGQWGSGWPTQGGMHDSQPREDGS